MLEYELEPAESEVTQDEPKRGRNGTEPAEAETSRDKSSIAETRCNTGEAL